MLQVFGYLSGLFIALGFIPYIKDILRLKTKPQRATWIIYTILSSIAFFSQLAKGAGSSLWLTSIDTLAIIAIFLLSIKYGVGGFGKKDFFALFIASIGLIAWYYTREAAIALYIVIIIDAAGTYLTLDKTFKDPESETLIAWMLSAIAGIFSMLAVGSWNIILLSYPYSTSLDNSDLAY